MATERELLTAAGIVDADGRLIESSSFRPKLLTIELVVGVKNIEYEYHNAPSVKFETRGLRSNQMGGFYDVNFDFDVPLYQVVIKPED